MAAVFRECAAMKNKRLKSRGMHKKRKGGIHLHSVVNLESRLCIKDDCSTQSYLKLPEVNSTYKNINLETNQKANGAFIS